MTVVCLLCAPFDRNAAAGIVPKSGEGKEVASTIGARSASYNVIPGLDAPPRPLKKPIAVHHRPISSVLGNLLPAFALGCVLLVVPTGTAV